MREAKRRRVAESERDADVEEGVNGAGEEHAVQKAGSDEARSGYGRETKLRYEGGTIDTIDTRGRGAN